MNHEEVKKKLLTDPWVREAYENPPMPLAIARAVVEGRKERGITQEELAERMGTSQAQIWRIESGSFNPTSKTLARVEKALGVSLNKLYRRQEQNAALHPEKKLKEWRDTGLLVMSDEDFETALELEEISPGQLRRLVKAIEAIELEEGDCVEVAITVAEAREQEGGQRHRRARRLALSATL